MTFYHILTPKSWKIIVAHIRIKDTNEIVCYYPFIVWLGKLVTGEPWTWANVPNTAL